MKVCFVCSMIFMARIENANSPRVLKANTPKLSIQPSATNFKATENYTLKSNRNNNDNKKVKTNGDRPRRATYLRQHCGKFCFLLYRVTNQSTSLPLISPTEFLFTETMSLFRKESNETYRLKCLHCKITTIFQKKNGICFPSSAHYHPSIIQKALLTEENKAPTFVTLLAAKEHVLEDYTPAREVKRMKIFLVSIEKDFRCLSERCQNI